MPVEPSIESNRVYRCTQLLKASRSHRGALSSLRNLPLCSVEGFIEAARTQALQDVEFLRTLGFHLQDSATSPAVQQCGSVDSSRPIADSPPLAGAKGKKGRRSGGTPLKAKKGATVGGPTRPVSPLDSPFDGLTGLLSNDRSNKPTESTESTAKPT